MLDCYIIEYIQNHFLKCMDLHFTVRIKNSKYRTIKLSITYQDSCKGCEDQILVRIVDFAQMA